MTKENILLIISKRWFLIFSLVYSLFIGLPFLAPILMYLGFENISNGVYSFYSIFCHQYPQRSFFFFGSEFMYSLADIQIVWKNSIDPWGLRSFIGNTTMGWKVAWSDRMVSMYSSILIAAWIWYPLRKKINNFPLWAFILLIFPMAIDGTTHMISDFAGIGQGFRDSNLWLAQLTDFMFPQTFYAGDALGSFNSWMRLITGTLFGVGVVFFGFPYVEEIFVDLKESIEYRLNMLDILEKKARKEIFLNENK